MATAAPLLLLRGVQLIRARVTSAALSRRSAAGFSKARAPQHREPPVVASESSAGSGSSAKWPPLQPPPSGSWANQPEYRLWKEKELEILKDIEPIIFFAKDILHSSSRYMDGERLNDEDEIAVIKKLLVYHPHLEDKIGCGLDSIMVDRHPQFRNSRCLFVVRIYGGWIDFSYQKCLRAYIREKYPSHAERFIRGHFKR